MTDRGERAARWPRVQEILNAALERAGTARERYLDEACGSDTTLRSEVVSLLAHADTGLLGDPDDYQPPIEPEADRIGPFRIIGSLGHGGMGSVYLAEREGTGFTQRVALKLLRAGMLVPAGTAPQLEERFNRERHILARLEHSGIARLIDGGCTPTGQPYLAMEYVDGMPLTEYARHHALGIRDRVGLFIDVCEAVQYAHQRLVIHRDLKPSNILVADTGHPKLLDFGIATFAEAEDATAAQTGSRTGLWFTPSYASPEQVRRERVTTLSDLYSLGVVLYELLVDVRPYEAGSLSPGGLEDIVCRRIPERPSARAARPRLARLLRGDLDTIVLKALAKEPERRYGSVRDLADDLRRHLRREPVHARPDNFAYRLSTFLQRNRTAGAAAIVVLAGLVATTWQARRAERARAVAEAARRQAEEVSDFLIGIFEASDPQQAPVDPALATAILERGVARADQLAEQPAVRARLLDALGMVFLNLGRYDDAHRLVTQALGIRMATFGTTHADVAVSLQHMGQVKRAMGEYSAAETVYRQALDIQQRVLGPDDPATAQTLSDIAFLLPYLGRAAEAESAYREVLAIRRRSLPPDDPAIGDAILRVAAILRSEGRTAQAESVGREGIAFRERVLGPDHPDVGAAIISVADYVAEDSTRRAEAERMYRQGLDIQRHVLGDRHLALQHGMNNLAELLVAAGRYREADSLFNELLVLLEERLGPDHESVGSIKESMADLLAAQGHLDQAIALRKEGLAIMRRAMGPSHPSVAGSLDGLARLYLLAKDDVAAESLLVEAVEIRRATNGPTHPFVGRLLVTLGQLNTRHARYEVAERQLLEARTILEGQMAPDHPDARRAREALVALYEAWGKPDRAAAVREGGIRE
jgi:serine/threonine protein kinase/tetratricopeptide (TPR) repeat protein